MSQPSGRIASAGLVLGRQGHGAKHVSQHIAVRKMFVNRLCPQNVLECKFRSAESSTEIFNEACHSPPVSSIPQGARGSSMTRTLAPITLSIVSPSRTWLLLLPDGRGAPVTNQKSLPSWWISYMKREHVVLQGCEYPHPGVVGDIGT